MARPQKQTIDYFPHQVTHGKTLLILQNEFGNDGYAFWFKLLELLCEVEGQVYDYKNPASWRLLLAKTHVKEDIAEKILQILADIDTIDAELYYNDKIIWVQKLVDNLDLVYKRRNTGTPIKPVSVSNNLVNVNNNTVNVNKSTQTKQNKTKQNNKKEIVKKKYGEFQNVHLTDEEYKKLQDKLNSKTDELIEKLSSGIESKGYKYKSHYATILVWNRRDNAKTQGIRSSSRELPDRETGYTDPDKL